MSRYQKLGDQSVASHPPIVNPDSAPSQEDNDVTHNSHSSEFSLNQLEPFEIDQPIDDAEDFVIEEAHGTIKAAFFNMTNSIVGAGIVGIPRALKNSGMLAGMILLLFLAVTNDWTLRLIILNTKLSGEKTYTSFVAHTFGIFGEVIALLAQGLFAFGGSIGFAVIIGDTIPHVLQSILHDAMEDSKFLSFILSRNSIIVFCIVCISYPLSLTRDISRLAKASGLALISMLIIITLVVIRGPAMPDDLRGSITGSQWLLQDGIFKGASVISFAMVCHHNTTFIYDSMRKPTMDRFDAVTHLSCIVSTILCGILGISGYLNFGSKTKGNILNNFPSDDTWINVARFCFGLNMLTTFPLEIYVVREVVKQLITIRRRIMYRDSSYTLENLTHFQHVSVTSFVSFVPMLISLFTCNLGAILELVGATSASLIAYILPPLCYDKMTKKGKPFWKRLPCLLCIIFGFTVMIVSSSQTIMDTLNEKGSASCVE